MYNHYISGVKFLLSDDFIQTSDGSTLRTTILSGDSIPTDGSGRLLITDISLTYGQTQTSNDSALFCVSSRDLAELNTLISEMDWYYDSEVKDYGSMSTKLPGDVTGWKIHRHNLNIIYRAIRLKKVARIAVEGRFICSIKNDWNNDKSLLILYPSELIKVNLCKNVRRYFLSVSSVSGGSH